MSAYKTELWKITEIEWVIITKEIPECWYLIIKIINLNTCQQFRTYYLSSGGSKDDRFPDSCSKLEAITKKLIKDDDDF